MGITKCNTMDAIWITESRRSGYFGGGSSSTNMLYLQAIFHLLSTNDI